MAGEYTQALRESEIKGMDSTFTPKFEWQGSFINIIEGPIDDRTIHWVYDPIGNHGKTFLSR